MKACTRHYIIDKPRARDILEDYERYRAKENIGRQGEYRVTATKHVINEEIKQEGECSRCANDENSDDGPYLRTYRHPHDPSNPIII